MPRFHYFKCFLNSVSLFQVFQSVLILYVRIILSMPGRFFFKDIAFHWSVSWKNKVIFSYNPIIPARETVFATVCMHKYLNL